MLIVVNTLHHQAVKARGAGGRGKQTVQADDLTHRGGLRVVTAVGWSVGVGERIAAASEGVVEQTLVLAACCVVLVSSVGPAGDKRAPFFLAR